MVECQSNEVALRPPPIKYVADFLPYLFHDRKLQLSTIDCFRSAIAEKPGNSPINVSKEENFIRLLDSFHIKTDQRVAEASPLGTFPWYFTSLQRLLLNPLKRPP